MKVAEKSFYFLFFKFYGGGNLFLHLKKKAKKKAKANSILKFVLTLIFLGQVRNGNTHHFKQKLQMVVVFEVLMKYTEEERVQMEILSTATTQKESTSKGMIVCRCLPWPPFNPSTTNCFSQEHWTIFILDIISKNDCMLSKAGR